jgi:predicted dehydrogenase
MNFFIIGDGPEELAWARTIVADGRHHLVSAYPGFDELPGIPRPGDFEAGLAMAAVEAVVVGGALDDRGESLRRVAAAGLPAVCLHPPGEDAEAYYQVALSHEETGAIVVPNLPTRLHPGIDSLRGAIDGTELGMFRSLLIEWSAVPEDGDLAREVFPRLVDLVRALIGEIEAVTATGNPPGTRPTESLVVQMRGPDARHAEIRIETGPATPGRFVVKGAEGSLALEVDPDFEGTARVVRRTSRSGEGTTELAPWDPHAAILAVLAGSIESPDQAIHPDLIDATRAMELSEATVRSLRRGRTVDLHYEEISEAGTFKGVMTSVGCVLLMTVLAALPVALVGPALGYPWTIYIAYAIPPVLVIFVLMQLLRFAVRTPTQGESPGKERDFPG